MRPPHRRDCAVGLLDKDDANRYREYAASAPARLPRKYQSALREKDATYSLVQMAKDWTFAVRIDAH